MHVREWIEKNRPAATIGASVVMVLAIGLIIYQMMPEPPVTKAWYTTDDGQTWFKDSNRLVPPFDRDGKQAVLAHLRNCNGKLFVSYMERFRPDAAKKIREFRAAQDAGETPDEAMIAGAAGDLEYKRPGETTWTTALEKISEMKLTDCPDGTPPLIVHP